jgi:predicted SnoaL-like aldol condensation-catalyzing enzyme
MNRSSVATAVDLKPAATEFLRLASSGKAREAYRRFVAPGFRHHNPHLRGDAASLMTAMEENAAQHPGKALEVKHVLQEGDLVVVHSHVRHEPGERGYALAHIFPFEGDRIVELWDLAQEVPEHSPNEYGMF